MERTTFKIGAGEVDITPPVGKQLTSQGRAVVFAEGAYLPMAVRVLTIDDGSGPVVFISAELLFWGDENVIEMRKRLKASHGLEARQLVFNVTHTHSSPKMSDGAPYVAEVVDKTVRLIGQCLEQKREGHLLFGRGSLDISTNRRRKYPNGFVFWGINPYGIVDREVPVIQAVDAGGKTIAVMFNYACHPSTVRVPLFGGDWAGFAMQELESELQAPVLFLQGTAGELKPPNRNLQDPYGFTFEGGAERPKQFGLRAAEAVRQVLQRGMEPVNGRVHAAIDVVELPILNEMLGEEGEPPFAGPTRRLARLAKLMLDSMDENGNYKRTRPCEVQLVRIGADESSNFLFVGMNGEICVRIGLRIKTQLIPHRIMVSGYTNLNITYIPSMDLIPERGYEANRSPYSLEMEDFLVGKVMEMAAASGPIPASGRQKEPLNL